MLVVALAVDAPALGFPPPPLVSSNVDSSVGVEKSNSMHSSTSGGSGIFSPHNNRKSSTAITNIAEPIKASLCCMK